MISYYGRVYRDDDGVPFCPSHQVKMKPKPTFTVDDTVIYPYECPFVGCGNVQYGQPRDDDSDLSFEGVAA